MADNRHRLAEQLIDLQIKIADDLTRIADLKEKLRDLAIADAAGFTEEIAGKGAVEVSKPGERKFKGLLPTIVAAAYLRLTARRQENLIEEGLVEMVEQWTPARAPSVTVRV